MSRDGHTLAELTVVLLLAGIVGAAVATTMTGAARAVRDLVIRSEAAETRRTVSGILLHELESGMMGRDWALDGDRAIVLRAFRGYGRVCSGEDGDTGAFAAPSGGLIVAWRGERLPDPARDSVLALSMDGAWRPADLLEAERLPDDVADALCSLLPGERGGFWRANVELAAGDDGAAGAGLVLLLRYFERGRYSLEDGAFRYRRDTAGRQPLTPEIVGSGSRFHEAGSGIEIELHLDPPGVVDRWRVFGDR